MRNGLLRLGIFQALCYRGDFYGVGDQLPLRKTVNVVALSTSALAQCLGKSKSKSHRTVVGERRIHYLT